MQSRHPRKPLPSAPRGLSARSSEALESSSNGRPSSFTPASAIYFRTQETSPVLGMIWGVLYGDDFCSRYSIHSCGISSQSLPTEASLVTCILKRVQAYARLTGSFRKPLDDEQILTAPRSLTVQIYHKSAELQARRVLYQRTVPSKGFQH